MAEEAIRLPPCNAISGEMVFLMGGDEAGPINVGDGMPTLLRLRRADEGVFRFVVLEDDMVGWTKLRVQVE